MPLLSLLFRSIPLTAAPETGPRRGCPLLSVARVIVCLGLSAGFTSASANLDEMTGEEILERTMALYGNSVRFRCNVEIESEYFQEFAVSALSENFPFGYREYRLSLDCNRRGELNVEWIRKSTVKGRVPAINRLRNSGEGYTLSILQGGSYKHRTFEGKEEALASANQSSAYFLENISAFLDPGKHDFLRNNTTGLVAHRKDNNYVLHLKTCTDLKLWIDAKTFQLQKIEFADNPRSREGLVAFYQWKLGSSEPGDQAQAGILQGKIDVLVGREKDGVRGGRHEEYVTHTYTFKDQTVE